MASGITPTRRLRATPFTPRVEAAGVKAYTIYNHMLLPTMFESFEADYRHLKEHVQIWDVSAERQVELKGKDAHKLACMLSARDLTAAKPGRCYYAPICGPDGGMINDPIALCLAEDHFWFSIADSDMRLWAEGIATGLGLDVTVCEPDVSPLAIQGPKAEDLLVRVFGDEIRSIKFFNFKAFPFKGRMLNIARSGWSKQGGFEIYLDDSSLGLDLWDLITDHADGFNLRAGCPNAIERIESGLLSYGNDMTRGDTPLQIGLEKYVGLDKDVHFIGKDALLRQRDAGIQSRMMGVLMDGPKLPGVAMPLPARDGKTHVGQVTSGIYSPDWETNVGFAMLDIAATEYGTELTIETAHAGPQNAKVVEVIDLWSRLNNQST
ncbi:MAG: dimethylsulfoniopropionate demethylase [Pseudomonadota bacterium]